MRKAGRRRNIPLGRLASGPWRGGGEWAIFGVVCSSLLPRFRYALLCFAAVVVTVVVVVVMVVI